MKDEGMWMKPKAGISMQGAYEVEFKMLKVHLLEVDENRIRRLNE